MSKRIAILSSGPSLEQFDPAEPFDLRIGINRAATRFSIDWWSVGDEQAFWRHITDPDSERQGFVIGRPRIVTMSPTWAAVYNGHPALYAEFPEWMTWEKLRDEACPPQEWDCWSSVVGLVLAGHLGATEIITYGVDLAGESDFLGLAHKSRFSEQRWQRERPIWERVCQWLRERGCMVTNGAEAAACV